jgi:hypothetical protein
MDDIPNELVKAIAGGNAVLFLGAGLSRGAGLPGWGGLLAPLMDRCGLPAERRVDLLQAAQDIEIQLGRDALLEHVCAATDGAGRGPTANHRRLLELDVDTWVTTNYDDLLERTLSDAGQTCVKMVRSRDLPDANAGATTVLKLHGDRQDPDTIVITAYDYETFFQRDELVRDKLRVLLAEKSSCSWAMGSETRISSRFRVRSPTPWANAKSARSP